MMIVKADRMSRLIFDDDVVNALNQKTILVTGGHGFLGRRLVRALTHIGATVHAPTRTEMDLTQQASVRTYMAEIQPRLVIHAAAACGGIGANVANPGLFLHANALMGLLLLEEARLNQVETFVLISTTCAYPKNAPMPLVESTIWDGAPTGATGPYGMAKRLLHEAIASYQAQYGLKGVVLLPANLYGPDDHFDPENSHVVAAMIRRYIEAGKSNAPSITHWGTGSPTREFLHVDDAVRGIILASARHDDVKPVNLGTGVETSIRDLAYQVAEHTGFSGETLWDTDRPDGQPRRVLDVSRARNFGFESTITLSDGLLETIQWYRESVL